MNRIKFIKPLLSLTVILVVYGLRAQVDRRLIEEIRVESKILEGRDLHDHRFETHLQKVSTILGHFV